VRRTLLVLAGIAALVVLAAGARWLWIAVHVGTGFAAKITCSLALVSRYGRDAIDPYVAAEVAPLGPFLEVTVSPTATEASVLLGLVRARAVLRPGLGCTLAPVGPLPAAPAAAVAALPARPARDPRRAWPEGDADLEAAPPAAVARVVERAFAEPGPPHALRRTRAVVVARDGRLVAERYAPGVDPDAPLLSWSMAKSVTMALVGALVLDGRLAIDAPAPVPEWRGAGDPRGAITLDSLLRQSSGLAFDETYGATNDVSRMLFTAADTGAFAAAFPLDAPPEAVWSYSSGTSNIVARILRDAFGGDLAAMVRFAREQLFDPAGMTSALLEPDASGSFIGSSFAFMTARDWARFGELFRRDGVWNGRRLLPEGWVAYATTPTPRAPLGEYGAHWWLNAGEPGAPGRRAWPALPAETWAARGHSGQWVVVVPSARLVVVRLGLTVPDASDDGTPELVAGLLAAFAALDAAADDPGRPLRYSTSSAWSSSRLISARSASLAGR
jgi:CubicO group peptidase (beta-lactamase class C family)